MKIKITRHIESSMWREYITLINLTTLKNVIKITINHAKPTISFNIIEINIILTNDENIRQYNKQYRNIDKATNILAFQVEDLSVQTHPREYCYLGDLVISVDTLFNESILYGKKFKDHFIHLLIHGTLHLLGYDHILKAERLFMERLEEHILQSLNITSPYE